MANPLALAESVKPNKRSVREWIERGNRILWGQEQTGKGDYLEPKTDLHWVCVNGNYFIEPRHWADAPRRVAPAGEAGKAVEA